MKKKLWRWTLRLAALAALLLAFLVWDMWDAMGARSKAERLAKNQASAQWENGRFSNRLPEKLDYVLMLKRYWNASKFADAQGKVPFQALKPEQFAEAPASGLRITWFGHSSLYIEIDGARILVDPVWGPRTSPSSYFGPSRFHAAPIELEALPRPDAVLFSHDHYDHLDAPTIKRMAKWDTQFIMPLGMGAHFEQWGVPAERIVEKDWWEELDLKGLRLACLPARHFSGRGLRDRNQTLWSGWALVGVKHRVYYSGDTAYFHGFKQIGKKYGPFDASLIEVGSYDPSWPDVHVGPEQALQAYHDLGQGGLLLPVHWSTFNLGTHGWTEPVERLLAAAQGAKVPLAIPRPGQSVEPKRPPALERWWPDIPWQSAAQAPVLSSGL